PGGVLDAVHGLRLGAGTVQFDELLRVDSAGREAGGGGFQHELKLVEVLRVQLIVACHHVAVPREDVDRRFLVWAVQRHPDRRPPEAVPFSELRFGQPLLRFDLAGEDGLLDRVVGSLGLRGRCRAHDAEASAVVRGGHRTAVEVSVERTAESSCSASFGSGSRGRRGAPAEWPSSFKPALTVTDNPYRTSRLASGA